MVGQSLFFLFLFLHFLTLLGVYMFIVDLMTSTLFQGHRCARNVNYKSCFLDSSLDSCLSLNVVWLLLTLDHARSELWESGVCSREIIYMFLVGQVSGLVENFNIGVFSDTLNVINVKLCVMVLHLSLIHI